MLRVLAMVGGLAGAAGVSQFPEFSQQYLQRLAGQVDALTRVVADFDASAAASGLDRAGALGQMAGTPFLEARGQDLRRTFARQETLAEDLSRLRAVSPLQRLSMPLRLADPEVARATWADFRPAMPLTADGLMAAFLGFCAGWGVLTALGALGGGLARRVFAGRRAAG